MRLAALILLAVALVFPANLAQAEITGRARIIDAGRAVWDDRLAETLLECLERSASQGMPTAIAEYVADCGGSR